MFGLPNSIDKAVQKKNCAETIESLQQIARSNDSDHDISKEEW
jgi:hypothetical protein